MRLAGRRLVGEIVKRERSGGIGKLVGGVIRMGVWFG